MTARYECPECGSKNIVMDYVFIEDDTAYEPCVCNECGCEFDAEYGFKKITVLKGITVKKRGDLRC